MKDRCSDKVQVDADLSRLMSATRALRRRPLAGLAVALGLFALAFLARIALGKFGMTSPLPFATFVPVVLVAPLIGGVAAGLTVTVLSGFSAWWFFLPRAGDASNATVLTVYVLSSLFILIVMHTLDREFERLIEERRRSDQLFQELQHRIANNLQTVSTILRLQERDIHDPETARVALREATGRLQTMGALHRRLYDPRNERVDIGAHLREICRDIVLAAGVENVAWRVEADPSVSLSAARSLTLSLIVSEAIMNALKYAFPDGASGEIVVRLASEGEELALSVADNGVGLADAPDRGAGGLGTRIVTSLATQLGGAPVWTSDLGTTFALRFPR